jgi:uncharacterized protein YraI
LKLRLAAIAAALCLASIPFAAGAQNAYTAKTVHLRAGPARDYPVVAVLAPGTPLDVLGCLSDYSWCDVIAHDDRGWVYAANIEYLYQGVPEPVLDYGGVIGIGVITFMLGDYWDLHYHGRPWYRDRDYWIHRPRPVQPPLPIRPHPPGAGLPPPPAPLPPGPPRVRPTPPPGAPPEGHVPPPRSAQPGRPPTTSGDTQPPRSAPPEGHVAPPRSAQPGRPPTTSGDTQPPRK